jgi:hypothetical protein
MFGDDDNELRLLSSIARRNDPQKLIHVCRCSRTRRGINLGSVTPRRTVARVYLVYYSANRINQNPTT